MGPGLVNFLDGVMYSHYVVHELYIGHFWLDCVIPRFAIRRCKRLSLAEIMVALFHPWLCLALLVRPRPLLLQYCRALCCLHPIVLGFLQDGLVLRFVHAEVEFEVVASVH